MSLKSALVSVVMPAYNCAQYVAESIESALEQHYDNLELIVVDDGSTDDTATVLEGFGDRIKLITQPNAGAAAARNAGLRVARGDYVCFLDADDLWHPQKTRIQVDHLQRHPEIVMAYSAWREWEADADGSFSLPADFEHSETDDSIEVENSGWIYTRLLLESIVWTTTVMLRRSQIEQLGYFDASLRSGEDYDYWLRLSRLGEVHKLSAVLALYRIRQGSLARTAHTKNYGCEVLGRALERWGTTSPDGSSIGKSLVRQRLAQMWLNYAYVHARRGSGAVALDASRRVISLRPLWLPGWRCLLSSLVRAPRTGREQGR